MNTILRVATGCTLLSSVNRGLLENRHLLRVRERAGDQFAEVYTTGDPRALIVPAVPLDSIRTGIPSLVQELHWDLASVLKSNSTVKQM
jgi:hypothetical protein